MNRRHFLKLTIGSAAGLSLGGLVYEKTIGIGKSLYVVKKELQPDLDLDAATGNLSEYEVNTLVALAEVIIHEDRMPWPEKDFIAKYLRRQARQTKGYLKEYQAGVELLEEETKSVFEEEIPFHKLTIPRRIKVLHSMLPDTDYEEKLKRYLRYMIPSGRRKTRFFLFVVRDILEYYYSSAYGWEVVGYSNYPGVCGDLVDYTRPL